VYWQYPFFHLEVKNSVLKFV